MRTQPRDLLCLAICCGLIGCGGPNVQVLQRAPHPAVQTPRTTVLVLPLAGTDGSWDPVYRDALVHARSDTRFIRAGGPTVGSMAEIAAAHGADWVLTTRVEGPKLTESVDTNVSGRALTFHMVLFDGRTGQVVFEGRDVQRAGRRSGGAGGGGIGGGGSIGGGEFLFIFAVIVLVMVIAALIPDGPPLKPTREMVRHATLRLVDCWPGSPDASKCELAN